MWTQAKNGDDIFETGQLPVRDGNTFANGRGAETFTVQENGDQLLGVDTLCMLGEVLGKLTQDIGLCVTLELGRMDSWLRISTTRMGVFLVTDGTAA